MWKLIGVIGLCLVTLPSVCQGTSKYQVAFITSVSPHNPAQTGNSDVKRYEVTVQVGEKTYVALYTPALGESTVKYFAGFELLVLVGENTITYNDILGRSFTVPILSQRATAPGIPK